MARDVTTTSELSLQVVESYQGTPDENQLAPTADQIVDRVSHVSLAEARTARLASKTPCN